MCVCFFFFFVFFFVFFCQILMKIYLKLDMLIFSERPDAKICIRTSVRDPKSERSDSD